MMLTPTDYEAPDVYLDVGFGFRVWLLLQLGLSRFPFIYWLLDGIFKSLYIYIHTHTSGCAKDWYLRSLSLRHLGLWALAFFRV